MWDILCRIVVGIAEADQAQALCLNQAFCGKSTHERQASTSIAGFVTALLT